MDLTQLGTAKLSLNGLVHVGARVFLFTLSPFLDILWDVTHSARDARGASVLDTVTASIARPSTQTTLPSSPSPRSCGPPSMVCEAQNRKGSNGERKARGSGELGPALASTPLVFASNPSATTQGASNKRHVLLAHLLYFISPVALAAQACCCR